MAAPTGGFAILEEFAVLWWMQSTTHVPVAEIPAETVAERLRQGESLQVIDVRSGGEFAGRRIAGAKLVPLAEIPRRHVELDRGKLVVCVCQSGQRSAKARDQLARLGFNVTSMRGGLDAWTRAELPVEKDSGAPWSLERQVRVVAGALVLLGVALGWFVHPGFFGLSAFVGAGLVFAGVTDWCGMGLLLARAPWNRRRSGARRSGSPGVSTER